MRVSRPRAAAPASEQGAIAVILVLTLTVLIGAGALAVDFGQSLVSRRRLTTGTDAAALAVTRARALGNGGCEQAPGLLAANAPTASLEGCSPTGRRVSVTATAPVSYTLAGALGLRDGRVHATTTARYGTPSSLRGLRPFALCDQVGPLAQWLATGPTLVSATYTVPYTKESPDRCGANAPGNWGLQDFDGGANSTTDTRDWILHGYQGSIALGSLVSGDTGAFSTSIAPELTALRDQRTVVEIPTFDRVANPGAGALFHISGFVSLRVEGFKVTGTQAQRWLRLTFLRRVAPGQCCDPSPGFGLSTAQICGTDAAACPEAS